MSNVFKAQECDKCSKCGQDAVITTMIDGKKYGLCSNHAQESVVYILDRLPEGMKERVLAEFARHIAKEGE